MLNPIKEDACPKCNGKRTIYSNQTALCSKCNSHFDVGMNNIC